MEKTKGRKPFIENCYSSKIEKRKNTAKEAYRFPNHGHLNGVILDAGKGFLFALANQKERIRMKFPPSVIGRVRLVLE